MSDSSQKILDSFIRLKNYVEAEDYKGWDPFDGLNSEIFSKTPFKKSRFFRLAWLQFFKRSPLNLRKLTRVEKGYNSKGIALFLYGYCNLYKISEDEEYLAVIERLGDMLLQTRVQGYSGACWGYNFDWQARAFFQPKNTPTVVASSFATQALLEAYEILKKEEYLEVASTAAQFVLNDLNQTVDKAGDVAFSYSPEDQTQVYNASLLGVRTLCNIYKYTKDENLLTMAQKAVSFVCKAQQESGAWRYSPLPYHHWVDSFHSGYNLECIYEYQKVSGDSSFAENIEKGLDYYLANFFEDNGMPKYYDNQKFPIDIHAPSQMVATFFNLSVLTENQKITEKVLSWTIDHMQSPEGYFYYQINKGFTSKIPYMRWSQAWMFYAYSFYLLQFGISENRDS